MFARHDPSGFREALEGVRLKTLVHGAKTSLCEVHLARGALVPMHSHPHEQTGFLVSGRLRFVIDGVETEAEPGDSWCISGGVEHSADALADTVVVEVFSPVRDDHLPEG